jgi:hypothetical protein
MLTYLIIGYSERDCRENPAKHHKMKKITITRQIQNGAMQIGTESPFQHHLIGIILFLYIYREFQMLLGANAPHLTEESSSHSIERSDCLNHGFGRPDVASDREEGRHGAIIKFCLLNPLQVLRFGYLVSI